MILSSIKISGGKIIATLKEGGISLDVSLPHNLAGVQDCINYLSDSFVTQKKAQIVNQLSSLVGVDLSNAVAVFAALQPSANSSAPLAQPAAPLAAPSVPSPSPTAPVASS